MEMWTLSLPVFSMMTGGHSRGLVSVICRPTLGPALTFCSSGWCCVQVVHELSVSYLENLRLASAFLFLYLAVTRPALHLPMKLIFLPCLVSFGVQPLAGWTYMHIHSFGSIWHKWAHILHSNGYMFIVKWNSTWLACFLFYSKKVHFQICFWKMRLLEFILHFSFL